MEEKKPRGGQKGNKNARQVKHHRLAVSFSGEPLDSFYERLARQGEVEPTEDRVKDFIREMAMKGLQQ